MTKVIKRTATEAGDITPETGFAETTKAHRIISKDKFEAKAEAQNIREQAQAEAAELKAEAQAEAEQLLLEATANAERMSQDAREKGYREGREQGATELAEVVAQSSRRLQQIESQAIPQLKELSLSIARKILGKELQISPETVLDIVKQALAEKARQRREIFLRVNPDDLALIREHKGELLEVLSRCKEIGIREDPEVSPHGVIIETDAGIIDAQLETQLAVFERVLKDMK